MTAGAALVLGLLGLGSGRPGKTQPEVTEAPQVKGECQLVVDVPTGSAGAASADGKSSVVRVKMPVGSGAPAAAAVACAQEGLAAQGISGGRASVEDLPAQGSGPIANGVAVDGPGVRTFSFSDRQVAGFQNFPPEQLGPTIAMMAAMQEAKDRQAGMLPREASGRGDATFAGTTIAIKCSPPAAESRSVSSSQAPQP